MDNVSLQPQPHWTSQPYDNHWIPIWANPHDEVLQVHLVDYQRGHIPFLEDLGCTLCTHLGFKSFVLHWIPPILHNIDWCGALTISFLGHIIAKEPLPQSANDLATIHANLRAAFAEAVYTSACCRCPTVWGLGPGQLCKELAAELMKHGVPESESESRAAQAIKAIGSEQIQAALKQKQPWRQLKSLANNVRFQFLLPSELAAVIEANKGKPVGKKVKAPSSAKVSRLPTQLELDPTKLRILDGTFRSGQQVIPQIMPQQIGPVSSNEAEPYLRAGNQVSNEPLAMLVFCAPDTALQTSLPHKVLTVPCRCVANNEPILAEAFLVQLGSGFVEKVQGKPQIELESLEVVTIKMLTFKDEMQSDWDEFVSAPIKYLVKQFPLLRKCETQGCTCPHWHNPDKLPVRDPILDVWRRQFLRHGSEDFKNLEIF